MIDSPIPGVALPARALAAALALALAGAEVLAMQEPAAPRPGHRMDLGEEDVAEAPPEFRAAEAPPLARLVELARERSPRLAAARSRAASSSREIDAAAALDDPMFETRLANAGLDRFTVGEEEMSMVELGVRQSLPWPGNRRGRRELASAEAAAVEVEAVAVERALEREVSGLYARLYALDQRLARLDDAHELMEVLVAAVDLRFGAGEAGAAEALAMRLGLSAHDAEREAVAAEREGVAARLREALALPAATPIREVRALPPALAPPADFVRLAPRVAPAALAAEARTIAAGRRAELARLELRPELSVAAGLGWRDGLDPLLFAGAGVELPLFRARREKPRVEALVDDAAAVGSDAHALRLEIRAEAESLVAAWRRLERRRELYDEALLPESSAAFDAARAAFLAGDRELASLLDALERWLEVRVERAEIEAERFTVGAAVSALIGPGPTGEVP